MTVVSLVVLMAVAETVGFQMISKHQAKQNHVRLENRATRQLLKYLVDAETGVRGFLITRKPAFLEPYHFGVRAIETLPPERMLELEAATSRTEANASSFNVTLRSLRDLWVVEIDETSGARDSPPSTERSLTEGKQLMDALSIRIAAMMATRDVRIAGLDERIISERTVNLILILIGTATAVAV